MRSKTLANKAAWDAIAGTHYHNYDIPRLLKGEPLLDEVIRSEVGDVRGKSLVHLLCHIGTDTLSWRLLGADVTGIDISTESIQYARSLAARMNLDASFIAADVMELESGVGNIYDIVFASTGVLCWIPDIDRFAKVVRGLLNPGGFFYLHDAHPFGKILAKSENGEASVRDDYFHQGGWEFDNFSDYTEPDKVISTPTYEWMWTLGDIISAFSMPGLRISFLHEYPQYFYSGYTPYDVTVGKRERYPCTFSLRAEAE